MEHAASAVPYRFPSSSVTTFLSGCVKAGWNEGYSIGDEAYEVFREGKVATISENSLNRTGGEERSRATSPGLTLCSSARVALPAICSRSTLFTSVRTMKERSASTTTNLQDEKAFPSFRECPHENDIPYTYYRGREDGVYAPIRHWCFLGEITEKMVFNRLCLWVKDRRGSEVPANFHLDPPHIGRVFTPGMSNFPVHRNVPKSLTDKGNTIAILYAQQHNFMDGSIGFRIEDADLVQFFPCTLERLLALGDCISSNLSQSDGVPACKKCNTKTGARQRCSGCHVTWYCGKDCQVGDWSESQEGLQIAESSCGAGEAGLGALPRILLVSTSKAKGVDQRVTVRLPERMGCRRTDWSSKS
ncbi:hypothetical protein EDB84DRAFT_69377 [Lactarius hengduanensis]|nr:hypothetical protein EDB84DRAFT_69377 [Lactarius hengduanensis]